MKHLLFASAMVLLCAECVTAQAEAEQPAAYGRVVLTVVTDARVLPMPTDEAQVRDFVLQEKIAGAAAQEAFGAYQPERLEVKLLDKPNEMDGVRAARLELTIRLDQQNEPAVRRFAEAYARRLNEALAARHAKQMTIFSDRKAEYVEQVRSAEVRLKELIEEQDALSAADSESARRRMQEQERTQAENAVEQAVLTKRVEELSAYIDRLRAEPAAVNTDASSRQLREQISELEAQLEQERAKDRSFNTSVLTARIAEANILLAYRESELQDQAAAELRRLEQQRREAMLQLKELAAGHEAMAALQAGTSADSARYDVLQIKIQAAREALHDAVRDAERFEAQTALIQEPVVSFEVIGAGSQ